MNLRSGRRVSNQPNCLKHLEFNNFFPDEVIIHIFSFLPRKDLMLNAALVCKHWRRLTDEPSLWHYMDFRKVQSMKPRKIQRLLKRARNTVHIDLTGCEHLGPTVLHEIGKKKRLRSLSVSRYHNKIGELEIINKYAAFKPLTNFTLLRHLDLSGNYLVIDKILVSIVGKCPDLTHLNLNGCVYLTSVGLLPIARRCTKLMQLEMDGSKISDDVLLALAELPTPLETINIKDCSNLTTSAIRHLIQKVKSLKKFKADDIECITDTEVSMMSNLTVIEINECPGVTNDGIRAIVRNNPKLEVLNIIGANVDDDALDEILMSPCRYTLKVLEVLYTNVTKIGTECIRDYCPAIEYIYNGDDVYVSKNRTIEVWT